MKKLILILLSVFSFTVLSAQTMETAIPIKGAGYFRLGMTKDEIYEQLDNYTTEYSTINDTMEKLMSISNTEFLGYIFDDCILSFNFLREGLSTISLIKFFDKKNKNPKEFDELLQILENDYGEHPDKMAEQRDENEVSLRWSDPRGNSVTIIKTYDKKEKKNKVSLYFSNKIPF